MGAVGVFDSGVGGLSVLREIRRELPLARLLYAADSAHAPYGEKSEDFIVRRSRAIASFLIDSGCTSLVVACNTATAAAVDALRAAHSLPIVGVEPGVKPAAAASRSGVVGVLATSRTAQSARFASLLARHEGSVRFIVQACPGWVELVERGELGSETTRREVERFVSPLVAAGADVLVLGCTHYSFLGAVIASVAGPGVTLIDPAAAVARQLRRRLAESGLLPVSDRAQNGEQMWTSGDVPGTRRLVGQLWGPSIDVRALPAGL